MSQKNMDVYFMHVKCLFQKIQHAFLSLLKSVFTIRRKIYAVYISVLFKKSVTYLFGKIKECFMYHFNGDALIFRLVYDIKS